MRRMITYLVLRLFYTVLILLGVTTIMFLLIHLIPGDPIWAMVGPNAPPDIVEAMREKWGLTKPLWVQYTTYMTNLLHGDFGTSYWTSMPVLETILIYFPATLELTIVGSLIAIPFGIYLGILSATRRNSVVDHITRILSLAGVSMPVFWLGVMAQLGLGLVFPIFPISGRADLNMAPSNITGLYILDSLLTGNIPALISSLRHIFLPAVVLSFYSLAIISRITRASMLEVLDQDYIRTARAKGVSRRTLEFKHALRNAIIPIVTMSGLQVAVMLSGAVLTETVFSWPGLGRLIYDAITRRDYMLIQGSALYITSLFVFSSLIVDFLYVYLDPRIKNA
jgi:peptide/nickel transport system permease protein